MKVFLSWSGDSKPVAEVLNDWLPDVLQPLEPWFSPVDIDKGAQSMNALEDALASMNFGIICVTPSNANSNWLNYEAGSLVKGLTSSRVVPFLLGLRPTELRGPLANAQSVMAEKDDVAGMVRTLNSALGENRLPTERLNRQFVRCWPDLEERLTQIALDLGPGASDSIPLGEILDGIFATTKQIHEDVTATRQLVGELDANRLIEMVTGVSLAQSPSRAGLARLADRSSFPPLERQLADTDRLHVIGKSLEFMTGDNQLTLERFVSRGGVIRAILMDSVDSTLMTVASKSLHADPSRVDLRLDILNSVSRLRQLKASTKDGGHGSVEVSSIDYVPPFALTWFSRPEGASSVIVELYPFRVTAARRPHLYVEQASGLFGFFTQQFESVWQSGRPVAAVEEA